MRQRSAGVWAAIAAGLIAAIVASGCGGSGDGGGDEANAGGEGETQTISFQKPEDPGPEPFTEPADVEGDEEVPLPSSGPYGGSGSDKVCDRDKLIRFLKENPDRLREWARVLGVKPTYSAVSKYIAKLHPVTLTRDTQVTNHSFVNGRAVPFQAILQAGTAVLVDKHGRPVARCRCGNPLREPVFQKTATCKGCPPNYKPPKQCDFYATRANYGRRIYKGDYYDNEDYDQAFIRFADDGPYEDCWIVYPAPPKVTIIEIYREPPPEEAPAEAPSQTTPSETPDEGIDCENPRSQYEFEQCHPPETAPEETPPPAEETPGRDPNYDCPDSPPAHPGPDYLENCPNTPLP